MAKTYLSPSAEITWLEPAEVLLSASAEAADDNIFEFNDFNWKQ